MDTKELNNEIAKDLEKAQDQVRHEVLDTEEVSDMVVNHELEQIAKIEEQEKIDGLL